MANNVTIRIYDIANPSNYVDVTQYAVSLNVSRGKFRETDYFQAGYASVVFNNYDRVFDPTNTSSPLYGFLNPKQRIYIDINAYAVFSGLVDNWSFTYDKTLEATASFTAYESTNLFVNQYLPAQPFPSELSGARINRILDSTSVQWPSGYGARSIDAGRQMLDADTITENTNVQEYMNLIQDSEQGQLYMNGTETIFFRDSARTPTSSPGFAVFADDGSTYTYSSSTYNAFPYEEIEVSYSTELLSNRILVKSWDGVSYNQTDETSSQGLYGLFTLVLDKVLISGSTVLSNLAQWLKNKYAYPEYRFNRLRVNLYALSLLDQSQFVSQVQLNGFAKIKFKPNGTGSTIERYVRVIGIEHEVESGSHYVNLTFESLKNPLLVLDDSEFGKLDYYSLAL